MDPFGWRIASAVVGALMVLVMCRLARRLTGSTVLGCVAGLLLCFDGLHFVLSRLALLDIFVAFFLLCGVACLVNDRDWFRARLARFWRRTGCERGFGPVRRRAAPPVAAASAGCRFGLAVGTKWTALFPLAAFGLLAWAWSCGARRSFGVRLAGAPLGAGRRRPGVRPARRRRLRRLRRHLDRLAGARARVRGPPVLDPVHPLRPPGGLQGGLRAATTGGPRPTEPDASGPGELVQSLRSLVELPPGRLRLPRPLPRLLRPHLPVEARPAGCCRTARSASTPTSTSSRAPRAATPPAAATACARCCCSARPPCGGAARSPCCSRW